MAKRDRSRTGLLTCGEVRERIYPLLLRTLSDREREAAVAHISGCDDCVLALDAVRGRLQHLDGLTLPDLAEARKGRERARRRRRIWLGLLPLLPAAIAYGLLLRQGIQGARYKYERRFMVRAQRAIHLYEKDFGSFPPSSGAALASLLMTAEGNGPYIAATRERIDPGGHFVDSWGNRWKYTFPGAHNRRLFDLQCFGANGRDDNGQRDDLTNWDD